jgi:small nuclear ribonucleoprotein (snRNP)-like protein
MVNTKTIALLMFVFVISLEKEVCKKKFLFKVHYLKFKVLVFYLLVISGHLKKFLLFTNLFLLNCIYISEKPIKSTTMKKTVIKVMVAASVIAAKGIVSPMNAQTLCFPTMQVISNNDPTVTFSVDPGCPPSSGCGQIYNWNFGDGTSLSTITPTVAHTYTANGNYWVVVCPVDSCSPGGTSNTYSCSVVNITINGNSGGGNYCFPTLQIINNNHPTYTFSVNAGCTTNAGCITYYNWNFGDGTSLSTITPTVAHTYTINGNYYWVVVCPVDSCSPGGTPNSYSCALVQVNPGGELELTLVLLHSTL